MAMPSTGILQPYHALQKSGLKIAWLARFVHADGLLFGDKNETKLLQHGQGMEGTCLTTQSEF